MRKLLGITLAGLLGLSAIAPVMAQEAVDAPEDVLGVSIARYEQTPIEVRIDMVRALVARRQNSDEMARLQGQGETEAVLGEKARRGEVPPDQLQEMLELLQARASMDKSMPR
jgi:hypothetical protein